MDKNQIECVGLQNGTVTQNSEGNIATVIFPEFQFPRKREMENREATERTDIYRALSREITIGFALLIKLRFKRYPSIHAAKFEIEFRITNFASCDITNIFEEIKYTYMQ